MAHKTHACRTRRCTPWKNCGALVYRPKRTNIPPRVVRPSSKKTCEDFVHTKNILSSEISCEVDRANAASQTRRLIFHWSEPLRSSKKYYTGMGLPRQQLISTSPWHHKSRRTVVEDFPLTTFPSGGRPRQPQVYSGDP